MSELPMASTRTVMEQPQAVAPPPRGRGPSVMQLGIVVAILGLGVLATALTLDVTQTSEPGVRFVDGQPFLPEKAADWSGGELQGLSEPERKLLPADTEGARRIYTDKAGDEVFCSIVVAGRDVASIHRPEYCLPGQGWNLESEYTESVQPVAAPGGRLKVMRLNATRSVKLPDGRMLQTCGVFVYWFVGKDRVTPYHWQRILWTTFDRALFGRNHRWAYIMIYAPVKKEQTASDFEQSRDESMGLIGRFVQGIYPALVSGT